MSELRIDRTLREIIPPLTSDEYSMLEDSILKQGCLEPITVWNGLIIDGHNRYDICKKHGKKFDLREMDFKTKSEALNWMISNQLGRRNLTDEQKTELALKRHSLTRVHMNTKPLSREERKAISEEINVSESKVHKVKTVLDNAPKKVKDKMRSGEISINKAYQEVNPKSKPEKEPLKNLAETSQKPLKEERPENSKTCNLCNGKGYIEIKAVVDNRCPQCGNGIWDKNKCKTCGFVREI